MTDKTSPAQLKNRILGAILLVILGVLLIPLFLGEPKQDSLQSNASSRDFKSKITPLPSPASSQNKEEVVLQRTFQPKPTATIDTPAKAKETAPATSASQAPQDSAKNSNENQSKPKPATNQNKVAAKKAQAKPKTEPKAKVQTGSTWALQAGIFSKKENAEAIASILRSHGFVPTLTEFDASFGKATRVWVGPYPDKAAAQADSEKLQQKTGDGGYVAPFPFES